MLLKPRLTPLQVLMLWAQPVIEGIVGFELDFSLALQEIGPGGVFEIANGARAGDRYLFARYLPQRERPSYYAESGNMRVRATMAGLVAIDGPLPDVGLLETSTFAQGIAKIGGKVVLNEKLQRELQEYLIRTVARANGNTNVITTEFMVNEVLNFIDKAVVQPMLDTEEWMRGEAFTLGELDWHFADQHLVVDYGIPAANKLAARTGTDAYHDTTSKFWDDIVSLRRLLKRDVAVYVAHGDTIDAAIHNDANKIDIISEDTATRSVTVRKFRGTLERPETSSQYTVTLVAYDEEGEIYDLSNPGKTLTIPFLSRGKIVALGRAGDPGYTVGQGSTEDPDADNALGYTHLGPTVQGGGRLGRFARAYTPEAHPEQLIGEGVANVLPVIESPKKIAIATTAMPS